MITSTNGSAQERLNDAIVVGNLNSPECNEALDRKFVCGFARNAPRVKADMWHQIQAPFRACLKALTTHKVQKRKEGSAAFFNETELTGKTDGDLVYCFRNNKHTKSVTAFALDIDGTDTIERVKQRIIELGLLAIIYTTHSHAAKAGPGADYFRVIIPLQEPFEVGEHGTENAAREWAARYVGFCEKLGCQEVDRSAAKFVQMMYLPRRPTKDAPFQHYIIAGRALAIEDMPSALPEERFGGRAPLARSIEPSERRGGKPVVLADGFDVSAWFNDVGRYADVELLLEQLNWEVRNPYAGEGIAIKCPNFLEHSDPHDESDQGCWACSAQDDKGFVITCRHAHCDGIYTWNFLKLLEDRIRDGDAALPDEFANLSDLLCAEWLYPDTIDGIEVQISPDAYRIDIPTPIRSLHTADEVSHAFDRIKDDPDAGDVEFGRLFAGVEKAGNKAGATAALNRLIKGHGAFNGNDIPRLRKQGAAMLDEERRAEVRERDEAESGDGGIAHPSMDAADPLGETLSGAMATLANRWKPVSVGGKFCVARIADEHALTHDDAFLQTMSEPDFKKFHADRMVKVGDEWVNPAERFLRQTSRCSAVGFAPPPSNAPPTMFNLYVGRALKPTDGDCSRIKEFIHDVVCNGRTDLFRFVWLWMAHLVQRPGEKPGTAIVLRGQGGTGKSSFGRILERLCAPHAYTLADQEHVTGRFAGSHLAVCVLAICTESLFAGDPRINGKLKNLVTAQTAIAEAKGLPVIQVNSYTRFFFDSNNERVVPIDGDGSERRYLVMEIGDQRRNDAAYFTDLYADIEGEDMGALLAELLAYDPSADELDWSHLRIAPDTEERRLMRWHSMRPVERALLKVFEDGELITRAPNGETYRYVFKNDEPIRIPTAELNNYLRDSSNRYDAREGDVRLLIEGLYGREIVDRFGKTWATCRKARGRVDGLVFKRDQWEEGAWAESVRQVTHFFEFPPVNLIQGLLETEYQRMAA